MTQNICMCTGMLFSSLYLPTLYVHIHDRLTVTTYRAQHLSPCQEQLRVRGKSVFASTPRENANTIISRNSKEMNMENRMAGKRTNIANSNR